MMPLLRRLRRRVLLHRRPLAALLAAAAVLVGLQAAMARPPATTPVWTAARDLPSGAVLTAGDLRETGFAPGTAPDGAIEQAADVTGRTLATPLRRGQAVVSTSVVGRGLLDGHPGQVAVPVRITDPSVAALLRVGDHVDLVAADPQGSGARVLARGAAVLALSRADPAAAPGGLPGRLVVFAVPPDEEKNLAAAGVSTFVTALWRD